MLKATSGIVADYNTIKEFLLEDMKPTPNSRALSTYLFLTASRIHEALPWNYQSKITDFETHKALFLHELTIGQVSEGSGIYYIHVPYVLKRQGKAKKVKEEQPGRTVLVDDEELLGVVLDYINKWRPKWEGELLERTYFNPKKRSFNNILDTIEKMADSNLLARVVAQQSGQFRSKSYKAWYEKNKWLLETPYKDRTLADQLVFPFSRSVYVRVMKAAGYKIKGVLYDVATGSLQEGSRYIYTHFFREARVNTMYYELGYTLDEVIYQLGWREMSSVQYYFRRNELLLRSAFEKLMVRKALQDRKEKKAFTAEELVKKAKD